MSTFVNKGTIHGVLLTNGSYPAVILSGKRHRVHGEVFKLKSMNVLNFLDKYENAFYGINEYTRNVIPVELEDGSLLMAHVYIYNKNIVGMEKISSGKYLPQKRKKFSL